MNAVEIEEEVCKLVEKPFDAAEFPYQFLEAFGNKATTIARLRKGESNRSDLIDANGAGVLQRNNIHLKVCSPGEVGDTLKALVASPATVAQKAKFVLATDGQTIEAENLVDGETCVCDFADLPNKFGFFLELAGIKTVRAVRENAFDVKATGRLNKLYVELLRHNPGWETAARREDMNHFMARLIFCYFAEDTGIFHVGSRFTETIQQMTEPDGSNTHEVIANCFRSMDTRGSEREAAGLPNYARGFPYVNGGLFGGGCTPDDVPRFSKIARSYLMHIGGLDWTKINPDIFGSMIQAVADDEERGALGMHYTSVPNILKVLNPLFLDELREKLGQAGDRTQALRHLRKRLSRIRVFDPACGSGNFLVIAYKEMRAIEAEIDKRLGHVGRVSDIPLTNFRGIEIRSFAAEVARLALIIAEYQCDVLYRGQQIATAEFLPLNKENWITCGNALRLNWLSICPPTGTGVKTKADDLFSTPLDQTEIDFENQGGETYICGNPPYSGSVFQSKSQKCDLQGLFDSSSKAWKSLDYVAGWFLKAAQYARCIDAAEFAFVATNSAFQGEQVPLLWPELRKAKLQISFAHRSFNWSNLASNNAGVTVVIVALSRNPRSPRILYDGTEENGAAREVSNIGPYLVPSADAVVYATGSPMSPRGKMIRGNMANDGGHLILSSAEAEALRSGSDCSKKYIRSYIGSKEFINGTRRHCIWIEDRERTNAQTCQPISERIAKVRKARLDGGKQARDNADTPHRFVFAPHEDGPAIVVPRVSSESRPFLPAGLSDGHSIISERNFVFYGEELWNLSLLTSRLHLMWIATVCVRMRTDFSYSNTLGWNTFPVPPLTDQNKADLTRCAEDILLAREAHWPATIADMYDPEAIDRDYPDLRAAHDRNDETLERIYIGRRFKNDTERLEKLFEMYTEMTAKESAKPPVAKGTKKTTGRKKKGANQ